MFKKNSEISINFCPTGMIPTKKMSNYVPITINEIVEDVHAAVEIGITMVHLHARDEKSGVPVWQKHTYEKIISGIRRFSKELIICVTTSGRSFNSFEKRSEVLNIDGDLKPDMASLTLSSLNFNSVASVNTPDMIKSLINKMTEKGIAPELEVFDVGMINYIKYLERKGLITPPFYVNLLLGNISCAQANLMHAGLMVNDLSPNTYWGFSGIGKSQMMMNSIGIAMGSGIRIGLEDNIWYDHKRTKLATNSELIKRAHVLLEANEKTVISPRKMRSLLNLNLGNGSYGRKI